MASNWIMPSDADEGAGMPAMPQMPNIFGFSGPSTTGGQMAVQQQNKNITQSQTAQLAKKYNVTPLTPPPSTGTQPGFDPLKMAGDVFNASTRDIGNVAGALNPFSGADMGQRAQMLGNTNLGQGVGNILQGGGQIAGAFNPFSGQDLGQRAQQIAQGAGRTAGGGIDMLTSANPLANTMRGVFGTQADIQAGQASQSPTLGRFLGGITSAGQRGLGDFASGLGTMAGAGVEAAALAPQVFGPEGGSQETTQKVQDISKRFFSGGGLKAIQGLGMLGGAPVVGALDAFTTDEQKQAMAGGIQGISNAVDDAFRSAGIDPNSAEVSNIKQGILAGLDVAGLKGASMGAKGAKGLLGQADDLAKQAAGRFDDVLPSGVKLPDMGKFTPARAKNPTTLAQSALTGKVRPVVEKLVGMADDNTKRFVRVNTELVRNAPREVKNVMKQLQEAAKKVSNGQAVPSPKEIVGSRATSAAEALLAQRQNAGGKIGDLIKGNKTPINVKTFSDDLLGQLKTDRVKLSPDGIDFSMSKYADDAAAKSVVERVFRFVADKQDAKGVATFIPEDIQVLRDQIRALKPAPGITSSAGNLINKIDKQLKSLLTENVPGYAPLATKYARSTKSLEEFAKLLGKQVDDITAADVRAGEIATRLLGNAADRPMRVFKNLLNDATEYGAKTGSYADFEKLVKYADFLEDIYPGIVAPRGFEGGIAQGVQRGLAGGKAGVIDKMLEGTLKYAFGDNEKAVRQYFEALVDQAAGKQTGKVTKTGATVTGQKEVVKQAATGATKGKLSALTKKGAKTGVNVAGASQGTNPQQ